MRSVGSRLVRILALSLVAFGALIGASVVSADPAHITLKGGWSQAQFGGDLHEAFNETLGSGAGGIAMSYRVQPWLSIQPELWWTRKGGAHAQTFATTGFPEDGKTTLSVRYALDYIEVPVLARFQPAAEAFFRPHLIAGVAPAIRIGGKSEARFQDQPFLLRTGVRFAPIFEDVSVSAGVDNYQRNDVDLIAGGGFSLGRGRWAVELEGRYQHGLLDVTPSGSQLDGFNRSLLFTMGVRVQ